MFDSIRVKKNSTQRLVAVFMDAAGAPKTGLTVAVRVVRSSDGQYLKNDGTWVASPADEPSAAQWDSAHLPGVYYWDFALPDALTTYLVRFDGSSEAANQHQFAWLEAVKAGDADLHTAKAVLANRQKQTISTGVVTVYDDDGATALLTLTPEVDDAEHPTENILTPA